MRAEVSYFVLQAFKVLITMHYSCFLHDWCHFPTQNWTPYSDAIDNKSTNDFNIYHCLLPINHDGFLLRGIYYISFSILLTLLLAKCLTTDMLSQCQVIGEGFCLSSSECLLHSHCQCSPSIGTPLGCQILCCRRG